VLIGRKKEIQMLNQACESSKSNLVVIHGRRRIGKTYLVDTLFRKNREDCLFFKFTGSADQDSHVQRDYFVEAIYEWFKEEPETPITKWHEAFIFLKRVIDKTVKERKHKEKVVIFIDEVAWIDRHNKSGFLSAFGHFYNTYIEANNNLLVILCGSNASWIKSKIMKDTKGPLYQRVDVEISMHPFDLKETKAYLIKEKAFDLDDKSIVDIYMVLGGVAKYLSYMDIRLSVTENINRLFFTLNAPLYVEYTSLFKSLFYDKASQHKKIMDLLASKQSGFTIAELEKNLSDIKASTLKTHIDELVDTGFIKGIQRVNYKTKFTRYMVIDSFILFYTKWVKPLSRNDLSSYVDYFTKKVQSPEYVIWTGFAFETICIANIHLYLAQRGLGAEVKSVGYWEYKPSSADTEEKGAQIDILIAYNNHVYDIVECKYYNQIFTIDKAYAENLWHKKQQFIKYGMESRKKYDIKLIMLTTYGTQVNRYYNQANIAQDVTLENLIG